MKSYFKEPNSGEVFLEGLLQNINGLFQECFVFKSKTVVITGIKLELDIGQTTEIIQFDLKERSKTKKKGLMSTTIKKALPQTMINPPRSISLLNQKQKGLMSKTITKASPQTMINPPRLISLLNQKQKASQNPFLNQEQVTTKYQQPCDKVELNNSKHNDTAKFEPNDSQEVCPIDVDKTDLIDVDDDESDETVPIDLSKIYTVKSEQSRVEDISQLVNDFSKNISKTFEDNHLLDIKTPILSHNDNDDILNNLTVSNFNIMNYSLLYSECNKPSLTTYPFKPYQCKAGGKCEKSGKNDLKPKMSIRSTSSGKPFRCHVCNEHFVNKGSLYRHLMVHPGIQLFNCKTCGKQFYFRCDLDRHAVTHSGIKPYKCSYCEKRFNSRGSLRYHEKIHNGGIKKPYKCELCDRRFLYISQLERHISSHSVQDKDKERNLTCEICGKGFSSKPVLRQHTKRHFLEKNQFRCESCEKCFTDRDSFYKHMRTVHNGFKCGVCGKCFYWRHAFIDHIVIHEKEKPFICEVCGKSYLSRKLLKAHSNRHTRPHKCEICNKGYFKRSAYNSHMLKHAGIKPYHCDVCDKRFKVKTTLHTHMKTHSVDFAGDLKPHKCEICKKGFVSASNAKKHMNNGLCVPSSVELADDLKPYKCGICKKGFAYYHNLKKHMKNCVPSTAATTDKRIKVEETRPEVATAAHVIANLQFHYS